MLGSTLCSVFLFPLYFPPPINTILHLSLQIAPPYLTREMRQTKWLGIITAKSHFPSNFMPCECNSHTWIKNNARVMKKGMRVLYQKGLD